MIMLLAIFQVATADIRREFPVSPRDASIVSDAVERWSAKNGGNKSVMDYRVPIVAHMKSRRCVILQLRAISVGESPVYCYKLDGTISETYDDVE